jgi:SulP family sulfate permease
MLRFRPRLIDSLKGYTRADLRQDIGAGVTVGIVALPLAMAFGIASGVKPEQGIITAVIAGFLISLLGGSRVQIGGPAGAFVALLYAIGERYGLANLMLSTMMAGVLIFAMGALRLGRFIHLVPVPIITPSLNRSIATPE